EQIADSCIQLFEFAPISRKQATRFAVTSGHSEFAQTIEKIARTLELARRENRISAFEMQEISKDASRVLRDIWDKRMSSLWEVMGWYVVPLYSTILECMEAAEQSLAGIGSVWIQRIEQFRPLASPEKETYVLADHSTLREVLRNLFSNAKHAVTGLQD